MTSNVFFFFDFSPIYRKNCEVFWIRNFRESSGWLPRIFFYTRSPTTCFTRVILYLYSPRIIQQPRHALMTCVKHVYDVHTRIYFIYRYKCSIILYVRLEYIKSRNIFYDNQILFKNRFRNASGPQGDRINVLIILYINQSDSLSSLYSPNILLAVFVVFNSLYGRAFSSFFFFFLIMRDNDRYFIKLLKKIISESTKSVDSAGT